MENQIFVNQLMSGMQLDQVFLVRDKDLRTTRNGGLYIQCNLCDKTGIVAARMWQATDTMYKSMHEGGFLHIKGRTEEYRGNIQIIIEACRPVAADKVDISDYMAVSAKDIDVMWAELLEILRGIKNKWLRLLIKKFLEDQPLMEAFRKSPAAMSMHHPFVGGLLEHTWGVARAADKMLGLYPKLNSDLVLAGVFLHDIGKTAELEGNLSINYTDQGQLIGHITLAAIWITEKAKEVSLDAGEQFPRKTIDLLVHIILSHHGVHEYGSPKLPMIPEAYFIHYLDNLDAKMFMTVRDIENDPDENAAFTPYNKGLETRIYKNSGQLD